MGIYSENLQIDASNMTHFEQNARFLDRLNEDKENCNLLEGSYLDTFEEETNMDQIGSHSMQPLFNQLESALILENKYQVKLTLSEHKLDGENITVGMHDGCAHILRCLKVWYDMPSDVLFVAINYMDRFLMKMRAKAKYMACISVSSFSLAAKQVALYEGFNAPDLRDLVLISQAKCTAHDVQRMERIIEHKLHIDSYPPDLPLTAASFLRLYHALFMSSDVGILFKRALESVIKETDIWQRLEIVACDSTCAAVHRPSVIAFVLLYIQLQAGLETLDPQHDPTLSEQIVQLISLTVHIRKFSKISSESFSACLDAVTNILGKYNAQCQMPYRQRLVWKLSHRTRQLLRPTNRLSAVLPTIEEDDQFTLSELRQRCGSVSSEESSESEW